MKEFDFLEETYTPILEQEKLLSSKGYQTLKKNNIDTAELDGIEKEPEAGTIEFKELSDEENKIFLKDVTDFLFDIPRDTIISFIRGTTNASQFINNLTSAIGINPDDSYEFINERLDKTKAHLDSLQEDSPFVTKLMGIVAQDAHTYPIYRKLQKLGVPKSYNIPISFGLGSALAFDKKDTFTVDSTMVQGLKEMAGIDPNTPAGELYDKGFQAIEYAFGAKLADKIIEGFKLAKKIKNKKQLASDIAIGTAGGAVLTKSIMDETEAKQTEELEKITTIDEDKIREEKKTLNFDDQSSNQSMMEEFYGADKTQLEKISAATGYPVDQLQSAGATKIFTDIAQDPKTWQTVKKIITGISRQKKTIPTTLEQQQLAIPFIKTFDDDVKVLTYKVDDSVGKFSDDLERNLDIEALVKNDFDKKKIINTAVQQAKKYDQDSVFVSEQVLGRTKGSNAAFSFRFSTSKKFGDVIDISKELEKITGLQGYTFKTKALNLDTLPIANPKFIPNKRLYHNAIKRNGTTSNFRVAAFIGPDGRMIDGGLGSQVARIVEHRDVVKLAYDSRKVTDFEYIHGADFSQMYRFMEETGSIRISANGPRVSVEIYQKPTLSQLKTLVKKYNDDESFLGITIEAVMPKGESVKTFTRVEPEYMLELQGKINLSQLEKFLDFQAIRAKRFISIDSMNIPEYSNISNKAFIEKLVKIESNLSNTFGTKDISKPKLEYYINNVINKEDYAKYK